MENYQFVETLFIALIGASMGQLIIQGVNFIKKEIDLRKKKSMIINDLENQKITLDNLTNKYMDLKNSFELRKIDSFSSSVFHTLQLDIYRSVQMHELYSIFKNDLFILVDIYKSIEFLKENTPIHIYSEYLEKLDNHLQEKKNDSNHDHFCDTNIGFIKNALSNIDSHLKSITEIKEDIRKLR